MAIEIEKKYRLTGTQRERVLQKLAAVGATFEGADFEENILFRGGVLSLKECALRLRKTARKAILTYKENLPTESFTAFGVKHRIEHETEIFDGAAMEAILMILGYEPSLVYEKRRQTWHFENAEIVVDELPFGLFLEIEAAADEILAAEITLDILDLEVEPSPYPVLTMLFGKKTGSFVEARFE